MTPFLRALQGRSLNGTKEHHMDNEPTTQQPAFLHRSLIRLRTACSFHFPIFYPLESGVWGTEIRLRNLEVLMLGEPHVSFTYCQWFNNKNSTRKKKTNQPTSKNSSKKTIFLLGPNWRHSDLSLLLWSITYFLRYLLEISPQCKIAAQRGSNVPQRKRCSRELFFLY